ncbi:MAG: hypothetical protein M3547_01380 [Acidobacteriota bacterium]|nr:hypothetical protein [Acidobacteriota bacterium]
MSGQVQELVEQVAEVARQAARSIVPTTTGTVIGRNSDGTVNVDDGQGGCARLATLSGVPANCGAQVVLSLDTEIGSKNTVCPVAFAIVPSAKPKPPDVRPGGGVDLGDGADGGGDGGGIDVPEVTMPTALFATWIGELYDGATLEETGAGDFTFNDLSYGYSDSYDGGAGVTTFYVGSAPSYNALAIGTYGPGSAFTGQYGSTSLPESGTNIVRGIGSSADRLLGLETDFNATAYEGNLKVVIRDPATFAVIASNAAAYLSDWFAAHIQPNGPFIPGSPPPYSNAKYNWHVSADPIDGSFWVSLNNHNNGPRGSPALTYSPLWNIDPTDGSEIAYYEVPDGGNEARVENIVEIVKNGNFERGENGDWQPSGANVIKTAGGGYGHPHPSEGVTQEWFAIGLQPNGSHFVKQVVGVPSSMTTATLEFWLLTDGPSGSAGQETLVVQIRDAAGVAVLATLATFDNTTAISGWERFRYDISAYIGQTITLYFGFTETLADYSFGIFLDDVRFTS